MQPSSTPAAGHEPTPVDPTSVEDTAVDPQADAPVEVAADVPEPAVPAVDPAPSPLAIDDAEPDAPPASDLDAVDVAPVQPGQPTNLDLPSLELPFPAEPPRPPAPAQPPLAAPTQTAASFGTGPAGGDYAENLAHQAYGEPAPEPSAPPAAPYADSPYSTSSAAGYADPQYSQPAYGQAQYGQSRYGEQPYGQHASGQLVPASALSPTDEQVWSSAAHWSSLLLSLVSLPFLGPLLIMLIQGPKSARVRANAVESLNFDLTMIIGMLVSLVLMLVIIGFVTAPILGILWLVFKIVAAVQTSQGQDYRYPFNLRMVK